jgi:NADH:ubiquinone reductase (H+-translocating)
MKHIVVLGGGFGGIAAIKKLCRLFKASDIDITLIDRANHFLFTPMLHEVATGGLEPESVSTPLRDLLHQYEQVTIRQETVKNISFKTTSVVTDAGTHQYDYLVIALGSRTVTFDIPGVQNHCLTLKTIVDARQFKNQILATLERAIRETSRQKRKDLLRWCIIGGGPTGVEMAASLADFVTMSLRSYPKYIVDDISIVLVQRGDRLVPMFSQPIPSKTKRVLEKKGVIVRTDTAVTHVRADVLTLNTNETIRTHTALWVAGVGPQHVPFDSQKEKSKRGCLLVNPKLQMAGHTDVFVIGDMAHCESPDDPNPLPALAQVAQAQGMTAAKNIYLTEKRRPLRAFSYTHRGQLLSVGSWFAAFEYKSIRLSGRLVWLVWHAIYFFKLPTGKNRFEVLSDWFRTAFSGRDTTTWE